MVQNSFDNSNSLYIVPTPIGNLEDITFRALNVLKNSDIILCEDTRTSSILLKHFNINKRLVSCHEYNEKKIVYKIIQFLKDGLNLALITDQGTPIISDPGFFVVKDVINAGFNVVSLPGATAFVPALTSSGIAPSPFLFYGFLNSKKSKRLFELCELKNVPYSIIFYESVHRITDTLSDLLNIFGNREISLCREITKLHEQIFRGKISDVLNQLEDLKGEFVLVVSGNDNIFDFGSLDVVEHVNLYVSDGLSVNDSIKKVARERNVAKSIIYSEYHNRK